jgi:SAM-dependent methyltransferase
MPQSARISAAVEYALNVHALYSQMLGDNADGLRVLELGPGTDFGPQVLMADRVRAVTLADPYLADWDPDFHPAFYRELRGSVGASPSLDQVIDEGRHDGVLRLAQEPAERMTALPDGGFDVVLSNAVLEHVADIEAAAAELRRVSDPGAWHSHQVDFRYHRDFSRPLEHLLWSRWTFERRANAEARDFGCQTRPDEMRAVFEAAGFTVKGAAVSDRAAPDYLDDFMRRVRRRLWSPYRRWPRERLEPIGVRFTLRA